MHIVIGSSIRTTPAVLSEFLLALSILDMGQHTIEWQFIDDNIDPCSSILLKAFMEERSGIVHTHPQKTPPQTIYFDPAVLNAHRQFLLRAAHKAGHPILIINCHFLLHPHALHMITDGGNCTLKSRLPMRILFPTIPDEQLPEPGIWAPPPQYPPQKTTTESRALLFCISAKYDQYKGWNDWCNSFEPDTLRYNAVQLSKSFARLSSYFYLDHLEPLYPNLHTILAKSLRDRFTKTRSKNTPLSITTAFPFGLTLQDSTSSLHLHMLHIGINAQQRVQYVTHNILHTSQNPNGLHIERVQAPQKPTHTSRVPLHYHPSKARPRLVASLIIRNESSFFLENILTHLCAFVDAFVIIDDDSSDHSADLCRKILKDKPLTLVELKSSLFSREHLLRRYQWELTQAQNPEWILCLDADEFFEDAWHAHLPPILKQKQYHVVGFRKYDMWDDTHYRDDELWNAHKAVWPHLVRNLPQIDSTFQQTHQHCGRIPVAYDHLPMLQSVLRIKHYGSATPTIREKKFRRYALLDPQGLFGNLAQYSSLMDPSPNLIEWTDTEQE